MTWLLVISAMNSPENSQSPLPSRTFANPDGPSLEDLAAQSGSRERFLAEGFQEAVEIVKQSPQDASAHIRLGKEYWRRGARRSALLAFKEALELESDLPFAHQSYGDACLWMVRFEDCHPQERKQFLEAAVDSCRRVVQHQGNSVDAHFKLGLAYFLADELSQAEEHFLLVIDRDPGHTDAQLMLGKTCLQCSRLGGAETALREVLAHEPHSVEALLLMGHLLLRSGRFKEAQEHAEFLLQIAPLEMEAHELCRQIDNAAADAVARQQNELMEKERLAALPPGARYLVEAANCNSRLESYSYTEGRFRMKRALESAVFHGKLSLSLFEDGSGGFRLKECVSGCEVSAIMQWRPGLKACARRLQESIEDLLQGNFEQAAARLREAQLTSVSMTYRDNHAIEAPWQFRRFYYALIRPEQRFKRIGWNIRRLIDWWRKR